MYLKLTDQEIRDFITRNGHRKMIITQGKEFIHEDSVNVFDLKGISDELDIVLTSFLLDDDVTFEIVAERIVKGDFPLLCKGVQSGKYFISNKIGSVITTEMGAWTGTHDTILEINKTVFNNWCAKHRK